MTYLSSQLLCSHSLSKIYLLEVLMAQVTLHHASHAWKVAWFFDSPVYHLHHRSTPCRSTPSDAAVGQQLYHQISLQDRLKVDQHDAVPLNCQTVPDSSIFHCTDLGFVCVLSTGLKHNTVWHTWQFHASLPCPVEHHYEFV